MKPIKELNGRKLLSPLKPEYQTRILIPKPKMSNQDSPPKSNISKQVWRSDEAGPRAERQEASRGPSRPSRCRVRFPPRTLNPEPGTRYPAPSQTSVTLEAPATFETPVTSETPSTDTRAQVVAYRGTSLTRNYLSLSPYGRTMPRALWWSQGGGGFL